MQSRIERVDAAVRHELEVASFPVVRDGQPAQVDGWSVTSQDLDGMSTDAIRAWIYWNDGNAMVSERDLENAGVSRDEVRAPAK